MLVRRPAGAFFLASYRSAVFGTFLQASNLVSYWLEDFAEAAQRQRKITNVAPTTLSEVLTASQSTFVKS